MKSLQTSKLLILLILLMTATSSLQLRAQSTTLETITLSEAPIFFSDFSKMGSGYNISIQGAFPASDGNSYSGWTKGNVQYASSSNKLVAKFGTSNTGWLKSPTIKSEYGFTVTITYSAKTSSTLKIYGETAVSGEIGQTYSETGTGLTMVATTKSSSTTFTITNTGSSPLYVSQITITPNTGSSGGSEETKKAPDISFEQESYTATLEQAFESPVLSNPNSLENITYTSSDKNVATVDNSGSVSLFAAGTTTITASFLGDDTYEAGSASYTLTVQAASTPIATTFYKLITSSDELVDGSVCLLYCGSKNIMASSFNTTKAWLNSSSSVTLKNECYAGEVNGANLPYEITITQKDGSYALYTSNIYLTPYTSQTIFGTNSSAKYSWDISFKTTGNVTIQNIQETTNNRYIGYDTSSGYFKNATNGNTVQLLQKQTTLQLKEAAQGWATYYNNGFAYVMPQGVKGYYVSLVKNNNLSLSLAYDEGDPVPANTPLLLYGAVGTYTPVVVNKAIEPVSGTNYMKGERDSDGKTNAGEDVVYYKLTLDNNGENIGFYYGAEGGAAFKMQNETTAYLALPEEEAQQVRSLILDPATITNLSPIPTPKTNSTLYDLSGRRVQHPQRGLYIQGRRIVYHK